ncbi:hypothetical protein AcdelDRAFT_0108 [Acidovorax delafieldii 2AN]|jgi:hypothetical protein|uniref:Peptidase A2 domain-containing protein n=1 Tax=Acidovorax delafieldii 2AN TaxID=573060 RepID=C5SZM8_ACIDE|nr:hypothetical protein [Acidovorax delafieldii]EER62424.1 hypothetical protein AcdelDRAFT_0108 [Acidovorax delafieldii 2AN]
MIRIPITLALRPGFEHIPDSLRSPVIDLTIAAIPHVSEDGSVTRTPQRTIRALLDTGADLFHFDEQLLVEMGAFCMGPDQASIRTVHGEKTHNNYSLSLFLPGVGKPFDVVASGTSLNDGSRAYEAILGMEFLKFGRLVVEAKGESYFDLHPELLPKYAL